MAAAYPIPDDDKPEKKVRVLAKIQVSLPEADMELQVTWRPAPQAKREAAAWLRGLKLRDLPEPVTVTVKLKQRSDDIPDFLDQGTYRSEGLKSLGVEYGAEWIERFPNWGRGR